jgi:hypothetical protein
MDKRHIDRPNCVQPWIRKYLYHELHWALAILKERDTGLESTKIWYLFSPLFRGADN